MKVFVNNIVIWQMFGSYVWLFTDAVRLLYEWLIQVATYLMYSGVCTHMCCRLWLP